MQRSNPDVFKFYRSAEWLKVKEAYKKYRYGLCERCGQPGYIVHHKNYISSSNIFNPEVTLNFDNLELLCLNCHNNEHIASVHFNNGEVVDDKKNIMELAGIFKG